MKRIKLRGHIEADGVIHLNQSVSTGLAEADAELVLEINPIAESAPEKSPEDLGWPPGFFERTYGCCADNPIERGPQGEFEKRDAIE